MPCVFEQLECSDGVDLCIFEGMFEGVDDGDLCRKVKDSRDRTVFFCQRMKRRPQPLCDVGLDEDKVRVG